MTAEQREQIKNVIASTGLPKHQGVNFTVSTGAAVPRQVQLQALPRELSDILRDYQGSECILLNDRLVLVEPIVPTGG